MKIKKSPFSILHSPLRTLSLAILLSAGAFSSTASAAVLAQWIQKNVSAGEAEPEPWNFAENVTVSKLTLHGSIYLSTITSTKAMYQGWKAALSESDYIGFTITPDAGFSLDLDQLKSLINNPTMDNNGWAWGYRIDNDRDGQFDTSWSYQPISMSTGVVDIWAVDINTTGTIEFGFFAAAAEASLGLITPLSFNTKNNFELSGTVSPAAVPEPSTYGLILIGVMALLVIRRRTRSAVTHS